jgi:hypothetical protein
MPYVQRNQDGAVVGRFAIAQPGLAEEWLDDGHPDLQPTREQQIAANVAAVEAEMNRQAAIRKYDSIKSAALRAGYPGPFHDEGVAYATWMDACYSKAYAVLAEVDAGQRPMPTPEEAVAMMPALNLP